MGSLKPHGLSSRPSPPFKVPETPAGSGSSQGSKFLGSPLQDGASLPSGYVEEFSQFCNCPGCFDLCYSLLEEVEIFLFTQFLRTKDIPWNAHPQFKSHVGSFRLWLGWDLFSPAFRAFLVACGKF